ncbi:MAG: SDR family NAD(P)-dependent oxidoreductase [Hyphomicrobiales bacterium]
MKAADLFNLSGEVALVTGASSGLGWNFAKVLAAHGARVVLAARRIEKLEDLKSEIEADGGEAICVALDIAESAQIAPALDQAEAAFGPVTILVNNAGIAETHKVLDMPEESWQRVLDVNLNGVWYMAQQSAKRMAAAGKPGSIINIGSVLSHRVSHTLASYAVAKAGVAQLTKAMAIELARDKIRVNAIAPGYILTEINRSYFESGAGDGMIQTIPQRRIGEPSELDGTLLLLASNKASGFMTGTVITVDGGQSWGV